MKVLNLGVGFRSRTRARWDFYCRVICFLVIGLIGTAGRIANSQGLFVLPKQKVIVTTDGEIDDRCSMVRFLLYTSDWDTRGIIHSSSKYHWAGNDTQPAQDWQGTEWLDRQIDAYEQVYSNLIIHHPDFPTPDRLRELVAVGNIETEGEMDKVTQGSERIVAELLDPDPTPIWLQAWGGANTIARALKTIQEKHPERMTEVSLKSRLFLISEQDNTYKDYIAKEWPNLPTLLSLGSSFGAIAYNWREFQTPETSRFLEKEWMTENILENHGPLCALYEHQEGAFRSEGDSPAFLHLIDNGLRAADYPAYGGWGGRFRKVKGMWKSVDKDKKGMDHSIVRWITEIQNDFAARADWCVKSGEDSNHPPYVQCEGDRRQIVRGGQAVELNVLDYGDPDGDGFGYRWWQFDEADSASAAEVLGATEGFARMLVPEEPGKEVHMILEVTDEGNPPLKHWERTVFEIEE